MKDKLSNRQRQILERVAEGKANKEIADELKICRQTVEKTIYLIRLKLGARNRAHAAAIFVREQGFHGGVIRLFKLG